MPYLTQLRAPLRRSHVFQRVKNAISVFKPKPKGQTIAEDAIPEPTEKEAASPDPALSERFGVAPTDLDLRLWDLLVATASKYPERDAVVSLWQESHDHKEDGRSLRWSYQQLLDETTRIAVSLKKLGCRQNMRLAAVVWNSAEWALFFWVAANLGMAFTPVDPRVPKEAQSMLQVLRPDVIVVQDNDGMAIVDDESLSKALSSSCIKITCSTSSNSNWISLWGSQSLERYVIDIETFEDDDSADLDALSDHSNDVAVVVFTSGTTGKPKGCPHSNQNIISQTSKYDPNPDPNLIDRWLVHTPVSHIFAINNALRAWRYGGVAVVPSKTFNVKDTIKALLEEQITIMSATPTLVKVLLADPSFPAPSQLNLEVITIAATTITQDDIKMCREGLGAKDAIQAYGMSEGAPTISWYRQDELLDNGFHSGVGKALPGVRVRICDPKTLEVLPYNQIGEIHVGGTSVISGYLDGVDSGAFYKDGCGVWLITGDQGSMDDDGVLYVRGRYKDIIIRGGENINPLEIEAAMAQLPGVQAVAIGVPDNMGGEVPVAVAKLPENVTKDMVSEHVSKLDSKYMLAGVYTLEDLGLKSFPVTSMGKIKKNELKKAVSLIREPPVEEEIKTPPKQQAPSVEDELLEKLRAAWEQVTGTIPDSDIKMTHLADSISFLRYCDAVFRLTGKRLYLQDAVESDTIKKQATLLAYRKFEGEAQDSYTNQQISQNVTSVPSFVPKALPAPRPTTIELASLPDEELVNDTLKKIGLGRSEVDDILPIKESLQRTVVGQRPQSYHVRMVMRVVNMDRNHVRQSLEKLLTSRPMMRTVLLHAQGVKGSHLVFKPSPALFQRLLHDAENETDKEARERWSDDSSEGHTSPFMFQAEIIRVREDNSIFVSILFSHSIIDALSLWPFHKDLERVLSDPNAVVSASTPFRLFSDLFSQYEDSEPARGAVEFHTRKLRGISRLQNAMWPPQRAPGWMISNDAGSKHAQARARIRNEVWDGEWEVRKSSVQYPRQARVIWLPHLDELKQHGIHPSLFAKAALTLFNVRQTGASHAIFNTWESGRSWPFVPQWMQSMLPPAMSIDGPTASWLLRMASVSNTETIMDFLVRFNTECNEEKPYDHVPWQKVIKELRDEGAVAEAATYRQSFVWDVSLGMASSTQTQEEFKALEVINRLDWGDCGFFWNMFTVDTQNMYFVASWDTAQLNDIEVGEFCDCMADTMRKMAKKANWNKSIGEVFER